MKYYSNIVISDSDLDIKPLTSWLAELAQDGAIVTFMGKVRALESATTALFLEHYQGMTEAVLHSIIDTARQRWNISRVAIVHRIGEVLANETIVFVGVSSAHRSDAFAAAEFIMDMLKNEAPFWKKEKTASGENWIEAKKSDKESLKKWH